MGDRLRKAREIAGLDQGVLAERMGVSRATVTNAERGNHAVRKIVLNAWSMATGVPAYWLETGETPPGLGPDGEGVRHQGLEPRTRCFGARPTLISSRFADGWWMLEEQYDLATSA